MEVISPKIIDDQRDAESFKEERASPSKLDSPSQNVTRKSTAENDSAVDNKSSKIRTIERISFSTKLQSTKKILVGRKVIEKKKQYSNSINEK